MKSLSNKRHKHQGTQTGVFAPFVPGASLISGLPLVRLPGLPTNRQKTPHPLPVSGESRFQGRSQIPFHANIFCLFPNTALYFGQIPDSENTLPDPEISELFAGKLLKGVKLERRMFCFHVVKNVRSTVKRSVIVIFVL